MIVAQIASGALLVGAFVCIGFWAVLLAISDHNSKDYGWAAFSAAIAGMALAVSLAIVIGAVQTAGAY